MTVDYGRCAWCEKPLNASSQPTRRFCTSTHASAFHDACRRYGIRAFLAGQVSLAELRELHAPTTGGADA